MCSAHTKCKGIDDCCLELSSLGAMAAFHLLLIAFHLLMIVDGQLAQVDGKVKQILIIIPSSFIHDMF
jgi:hypothetical protein